MTQTAVDAPKLENTGAIMEDGTIAAGIYTLIGPRGHRTVKLIPPLKDGDLAGKRILYVFTGTDNSNPFNYTGVAFVETVETESEEKYTEEVEDESGATVTVERTRTVTHKNDTLKVWKRRQGSELHKVAGAWLRIITKGIPEYRYDLAKLCLNCGRLLTNPESLERGYGPECWEQINSTGA